MMLGQLILITYYVGWTDWELTRRPKDWLCRVYMCAGTTRHVLQQLRGGRSANEHMLYRGYYPKTSLLCTASFPLFMFV